MKKCHHFSLGIDLYLKLDWLALGGTSVLREVIKKKNVMKQSG